MTIEVGCMHASTANGTRGSPFPGHRCPPVLWGFACRFRERSLCRGGDPEATSLGLHDWFPHLVLVVQVGQFLVDEVVLARVLPQEEGDFQGLQVPCRRAAWMPLRSVVVASFGAVFPTSAAHGQIARRNSSWEVKIPPMVCHDVCRTSSPSYMALRKRNRFPRALASIRLSGCPPGCPVRLFPTGAWP